MRITLNTFRKMEKVEETMIRSLMPTTSARSAENLNSFGYERTSRRSAKTLTLPVAKTLTFKIAEVR